MTSSQVFSRRNVLGGVLAMPALAIASPAHAAGAPELKEFEFLAVRDPQLGMQLAVADYFGLFKEEGINVTLRWQQSSGDVLTIMGGGFPIGVGNVFSQIALASHGVPVKVLCALADIAGAQGVALAPHMKMVNPAELEGKRCAFTEGTNLPRLLQLLAARFKFDASKIRMVNMAPSEGVVAAMRGDVDMILTWQPFLYRLTTMGGSMYATGNRLYFTNPVTDLAEKEKLLYQNSTILVRQDWMDAHPNTLKAMLRALIKAEDIFKTERARAMQALQTELRVEPGPLTAMTTASQYDLSISPALVNTYGYTNEWALGVHRIQAEVRPAQGIAGALLSEVAPDRVTWTPKA